MQKATPVDIYMIVCNLWDLLDYSDQDYQRPSLEERCREPLLKRRALKYYCSLIAEKFGLEAVTQALTLLIADEYVRGIVPDANDLEILINGNASSEEIDQKTTQILANVASAAVTAAREGNPISS